MPAYRFVGSFAKIYDTPFELTRYGQLVEIPDHIDHSGLKALITAEEWDSLGHTQEELKIGTAPTPEFEAKRRKAHALAIANWQRRNEGPAEVPVPTEHTEHIAEA